MCAANSRGSTRKTKIKDQLELLRPAPDRSMDWADDERPEMWALREDEVFENVFVANAPLWGSKQGNYVLGSRLWWACYRK